MVVKPTLPDGYTLPETVGEWGHAPESNKNGHAWYGPEGECAVAVLELGVVERLLFCRRLRTVLPRCVSIPWIYLSLSSIEYYEPARGDIGLRR